MTSDLLDDGVPPDGLNLVEDEGINAYGESCEDNCEESERPCLIEIIKQFWNEARTGPEPSTKLLYGLILFKHKILEGTRMDLGTSKQSLSSLGSNFEQYSLENVSPEQQQARKAELAQHDIAADERKRRGLTSGSVTGAQALAILCSSGAAPTVRETKLILSKENWTDEELKAKLLETFHPEDTPRYLLQGIRGFSNKGSVEVTRSRLMAYLMTGNEGLTQEEANKFIQTIGEAEKYNLEEIMNKITSQ